MLPEKKLLYLPNESVRGDQYGPRSAFDDMVKQGKLSSCHVFSFLCEARENGSSEKTLERLHETVCQYRPDIILWQHVGKFPVTHQFMEKLRAVDPRLVIAYHEGDVFGKWSKRPTRAMNVMAKAADVIFLVGLGELAELFIRCGAKQVLYAPHSVDCGSFGKPWVPPLSRDFDVVMIGNRITSRIPFLRIPGAREREELALRLYAVLGSRFAVFGRGWEEFPFSRGAIPFHEQEDTMRKAWLSISWDHFDQTPFYFSDRLPISLMSGVPHVTNYQPGYEKIFSDGRHLFFASSVKDAVDVTLYLLSKPRNHLIEIGRQAQEWVRSHLSSKIVYGLMIERIMEARRT